MEEAGVDLFLSFTPENIYYLTGHDTPGYYFYQCCVVSKTTAPINVLRRIETVNTLYRSWNRTVVSYGDRDDPVDATLSALLELGIAGKVVGLEAESFFVPATRFRRLVQGIESAGAVVKEVQLVEGLRVIKSAEELVYIRQAAKLSEIAMAAAVAASGAGRSENHVAAEMSRALIEAGGEYAGLPPFVKGGRRSSLCHATWGGYVLQPGDVMTYELPGVRMRYAAPLFRCGTVGPPSDEIRRLADASISSLNRLIEEIAPGRPSQDVHEASRANFTARGFGSQLAHRSGYSVGINYPPDWGEGHIMSIWSDDPRPLRPGMTFHLVPGITIHGKYELTFSETVLVTDTGCEVLTNYDRSLFTV
jgi:Xaa-Pro dipeptidase